VPASTAAAKPASWLSRVTLHDVPFAELKVRLQPRAKRNAILEERDGVLRVSVAAAPVDGLANAALCKLLAKRAGIARGRVTVIRGERSREKVVRFEDLSLGELRSALGLASAAQPPTD
jgi:uncharacterized protein YggU (UPF0235/DUF167 family)